MGIRVCCGWILELRMLALQKKNLSRLGLIVRVDGAIAA